MLADTILGLLWEAQLPPPVGEDTEIVDQLKQMIAMVSSMPDDAFVAFDEELWEEIKRDIREFKELINEKQFKKDFSGHSPAYNACGNPQRNYFRFAIHKILYAVEQRTGAWDVIQKMITQYVLDRTNCCNTDCSLFSSKKNYITNCFYAKPLFTIGNYVYTYIIISGRGFNKQGNILLINYPYGILELKRNLEVAWEFTLPKMQFTDVERYGAFTIASYINYFSSSPGQGIIEISGYYYTGLNVSCNGVQGMRLDKDITDVDVLSNFYYLVTMKDYRNKYKVEEIKRYKSGDDCAYTIWKWPSQGSDVPIYEADRLQNGNTIIAMKDKVIEINRLGDIVWQYDTVGAREVDKLSNGNILITTTNKIVEVNEDKEILWENSNYIPSVGFYDADKLENGNVLLSNAKYTIDNQVLEVNSQDIPIWWSKEIYRSTSVCEIPNCEIGGPAHAELQSIFIEPSENISLKVNETNQFKAICTFTDGLTSLCTTSVTWSSSNLPVGTIDSSGLFTAISGGTTQVKASIGSVISNSVDVTVIPSIVLQSITISPSSWTGKVGETHPFTATCHYSDGSAPDCTTSVTWNSANPAVANFTDPAQPNLLTALSQGTANITATLQGITSNTAVVTVQAAVGPPYALIADYNNHRVIIVDDMGSNIIWQYGNGTCGSGSNQLCNPTDAEETPNGTILITDSGNNRVIEVDEVTNSIVWSYAGLNAPRDADRLDNGNTLIANTGAKQIIEVTHTPTPQIVWNTDNFSTSYCPLQYYPVDVDRKMTDVVTIFIAAVEDISNPTSPGAIGMLRQDCSDGLGGDDNPPHVNEINFNFENMTVLAATESEGVLEINMQTGTPVWTYGAGFRFTDAEIYTEDGQETVLMASPGVGKVIEVTHDTAKLTVWEYGISNPYSACLTGKCTTGGPGIDACIPYTFPGYLNYNHTIEGGPFTDDFTDGVYTDKWKFIGPASVTESGGMITFISPQAPSGGTDYTVLLSNPEEYRFQPPISFHGEIKFKVPSAQNTGGPEYISFGNSTTDGTYGISLGYSMNGNLILGSSSGIQTSIQYNPIPFDTWIKLDLDYNNTTQIMTGSVNNIQLLTLNNIVFPSEFGVFIQIQPTTSYGFVVEVDDFISNLPIPTKYYYLASNTSLAYNGIEYDADGAAGYVFQDVPFTFVGYDNLIIQGPRDVMNNINAVLINYPTLGGYITVYTNQSEAEVIAGTGVIPDLWVEDIFLAPTSPEQNYTWNAGAVPAGVTPACK
jgi:hypothetical protein